MSNNIILIGYMGCGKSSVGKKLALKNKMSYQDLDDYIEEKEGKTIKNIFEEKGEVYFRKIENKYLKECLTQFSNTILSLGGGTPCFGNNMELIVASANSKSIYLQTSIGELSNRLFTERAKRPLIAHINTTDELSEFIAKHVFERLDFYSKAAYTIKTDQKTLTDIVNEIEALVQA